MGTFSFKFIVEVFLLSKITLYHLLMTMGQFSPLPEHSFPLIIKQNQIIVLYGHCLAYK